MGYELVRVPFHGDVLEAVQDEKGVWVSVRRCCESLGLLPHGQQEKLKAKQWACTQMICSHDASGREQDCFMLHLDSLPMWLATIEPARVKAHVRDKLIHYQREAAKVLADHFFNRRREPAHVVMSADTMSAIEGIVRRVVSETRSLTPIPAHPRSTVWERCRWKAWPTVSASQRREVRRLANVLLMDRHGETPDVASGPGSPCVYYGHQLAVLDEAIDRVKEDYDRQERGGGPGLYD